MPRRVVYHKQSAGDPQTMLQDDKDPMLTLDLDYLDCNSDTDPAGDLGEGHTDDMETSRHPTNHFTWSSSIPSFLLLSQGFASPCIKLWPVKPPCSPLLSPSVQLRPNRPTSTCPIWAHATTERARTSTAWSPRQTCEPLSSHVSILYSVYLEFCLEYLCQSENM